MTTVSLNLPMPPSELSSNNAPRSVAGAKYKRHLHAEYREQCRKVAHSVRVDMQQQGMTFPLQVPVTALVTFVLASKQRRDLDNMLSAFKGGLDALVHAGLLADDSCWALRLGIEVELGKQAGVRVRLESAVTEGVAVG